MDWEDVAQPIRNLGLLETAETGYFQRGLPRVYAEDWAPAWACKVVTEALNAGQDPYPLLVEYYKAVRELPPEAANSLLNSPDLLY